MGSTSGIRQVLDAVSQNCGGSPLFLGPGGTCEAKWGPSLGRRDRLQAHSFLAVEGPDPGSFFATQFVDFWQQGDKTKATYMWVRDDCALASGGRTVVSFANLMIIENTGMGSHNHKHLHAST